RSERSGEPAGDAGIATAGKAMADKDFLEHLHEKAKPKEEAGKVTE
ncbi:MAG: hypothetical protein INF34_00865, partial [Roseomonas sp.]|nr:hypothetical protein [Roseomonas sp.]